jgi:hypothetical protein
VSVPIFPGDAALTEEIGTGLQFGGSSTPLPYASMLQRYSDVASSLGRVGGGLIRRAAITANPPPRMTVSGLRIFHCVQHLGSQAIEPRKHQAIDIADGDPLGLSTPQHIELMVKDENFGFQRSARPQQPGHCVPDQLEEIAHRRDYQPIRR